MEERIGTYWLAGRLGSGGQGVVYDAYDEQGTRVALKVLHDTDLDRLAREATAAGRVAAFCTARILDLHLEGEHPYIVSEYIPGPSLRAAGRVFAGDDLHRLATAIATALTAIHEAGVVHRDLKPDNVLLSPDGPRVIDFGVARTLDMSKSRTGEVSGTPTYMPPEVFTGQRAGAPGDVFAWGAIVVFAATGEDPFRADNLGGVMHKVLSVHPDLAAIPPDLRPLVEAALDKDPDVRPAARDLLFALVSGNQGDTRGLLAAGTRSAGGVHVPERADPALGTIAEDAYGSLAPQERALAAEVFLRLVAVGEDGHETGRWASHEELFGGRPEPEATAIQHILRVFSYVVTTKDDVVGLSRPALLRAWPRLRMWVNADRDGLAVLTRINDAARQWSEHGRRDGDLLQGSRLEQALTWAATGRRNLTLTPRERDFLRAGSALTRRRTRRRRLVTGALALLLVLAVGAGALSVRQSQTIAQQRDEATARRVALEANTLRASNPALAMLLSVAAWQLHDDVETRSSLMYAAQQRETVVADDSQVPAGGTTALGNDGRTLAVAGPFGVRLIDLRTGRRVGGWDDPALAGQNIQDVSLNAAGTLLAVATDRGITVSDARTGRRTTALKDAETYLGVSIGFTEQDSTLGYSLTSEENRPRLWNVTTGSRTVAPAVADKRIAKLVGSGTSRLGGGYLVVFKDRTVRAWRTADWLQVLDYRSETTVQDARIDRDRHTLWVLGDGALGLDLRPLESVTRAGKGKGVLSGDGTRLALLNENQPLQLWHGPTIKAAGVTQAAFDPAGTTLVTSGGRSAEAWDPATGRRLWSIPMNLDLDPGDVTFSPDGTRVAIGQIPYGDGGGQGELLILDARTGRKLMTSPSVSGRAVFSGPDRVVTGVGEVIDVPSGTLSRTEFSGALASGPRGLLAADAGDGRIRLWGYGRPLRGAGDVVDQAAFNSDGSLLASAGTGGTVQLWDVATHRRVGGTVTLHDSEITSLAFHGGDLLAADKAGQVHTIPISPAQHARSVCARAGRGLTRQEWAAELPELPFRDICNSGRSTNI